MTSSFDGSMAPTDHVITTPWDDPLQSWRDLATLQNCVTLTRRVAWKRSHLYLTWILISLFNRTPPRAHTWIQLKKNTL